ncbi:ATP-binding protein [Mesorhizobium sp.]|uniref:ATP-binding protein n=1 Tax=Mesorhizobium sp. TaxID=1871066 RepID=UPI000FE31296|nr:ATP-binding protein [Mesorhizobium sp.]RWN59377.1 MAG: ATP-binding protein [Mesorhizobium sp.]RWN80883.1 MAG: ATP-binding protein [Mesorhizobium sp.]RWN83330.1 MAG: ATP-binding protein [Mesorhizobium sp.]RWN86768.1 MAG: ATP-binding protein [Mesorhizobium sp.]RWO16403.1 MAG: ATP-binding protein [Mesorhizobium sp.]
MTGAVLRTRPPATEPIGVAREDIRLGKDVLELVSSAMYVEPMTVYREYIQNAADAVDAARAAGILANGEPGRVEIGIDAASRAITIRDNGAGIPGEEFATRLTALGSSAKRGTSARGFRGVGRLVGLGYTQELIFRSRAREEDEVLELRWDCRRLKAALSDPSFNSDVSDLISQIVSVTRVSGEDYPPHFFEVELAKVVRQRGDKLMNPSAVADYLAQVAPVPFSSDFRFGEDIVEALTAVGELGELDIRINAGEPLRRPHRNEIALSPVQVSAFDELSIVEIPGMDGDLAAVGWFLHHGYEGALPVGTLVKGVRLRVGNLQIGEQAILEDIFPESRFNAWSVGEIHIVDPRIVPNGRRDQFEQNVHFNNLVNHLGPSAREIARRCRTNSARRSKLREFELISEDVRNQILVLSQGGVDATQRNNFALAVDAGLLRLAKIVETSQLIADRSDDMQAAIADLRASLAEAMEETQAVGPLDRLPAQERAMYEKMFGLIYECSANRNAAKSLVDRIIQKIADTVPPVPSAPARREPGAAQRRRSS